MKKIKKSQYKLSVYEQKKCHTIIHAASSATAAVGAGLAQIPLADNTVITPVQITMIISLGKVFDQAITKTVAKSLLGGFVANIVGRSVAQLAWGWIPGVGNVSNAIIAATITESIGWLCVDHFYKLKYMNNHVINETEIDTSTEDFKEKSREERSKREKIIEHAREFINGNKDRETHRDELEELLDDMAEYLTYVDDDNEMSEMCDKIIQLF